MAVVLRVKRPLDEEPLEALVLSCKRKKICAESDEPFTAVFKFAKTVTRQDDGDNTDLSNFLEHQRAKSSIKSTDDVLKKSRLQAKLQSEESRFKLVNYYRALNESNVSVESDSNETGKEYTILDVEAHQNDKTSQATSAGTEGVEDNEGSVGKFVYDLYHKEPDSDTLDLDDLLMDGLVSVNPLDAELVFESYREHKAQDHNSDSEDNCEDEDSNDENNWRNDYPDEDNLNSDEGDDDDGLARDMDRVMIGNEELSSDEGGVEIYDEKLSVDEILYGSSYAKYKRRVCDELYKEDSEKSSSNSSCSELSGLDVDEDDQ